ncbi:hypothetical protein M8C21_012287 [Ambrosia artemisiifolia]|uniref:Uncharacterized protein n=1 Tax=Ambrosia artemisiifolia TaxID=4212 RepID=A0AAD5G319_AMBAR|nr:hypothetical protein M8C21_012287 [Ambrosia artemisiifolia]
MTNLVTEQLATTGNHPHLPNFQFHHLNSIPGDRSRSHHNKICMAQIEPLNSARLWVDSCILNKKMAFRDDRTSYGGKNDKFFKFGDREGYFFEFGFEI